MTQTVRRNKYNAQRIRVGSAVLDSKGEASRWFALQYYAKQGKIRDLERQVSFPLEVNGILIATYRCDFRYSLPCGWDVVEDYKGVLTPEFKIKQKLMRACYGIEVYISNKENVGKLPTPEDCTLPEDFGRKRREQKRKT